MSPNKLKKILFVLLISICVASTASADRRYLSNVIGGVSYVKSDGSVGYATVQRKAFSGAVSGNNTLIAAVASRRLIILHIFAHADSQVGFKVTDAAGGSDIICDDACTINPGFAYGFAHGIAETSAGNAAVMNLDAAVNVAGTVVYIEAE